MITLSGERHCELMSLIVAIVIAEQSTYGMGQELEPNGERCAPMKQRLAFFWL
jgi:hypothetical protein